MSGLIRKGERRAVRIELGQKERELLALTEALGGKAKRRAESFGGLCFPLLPLCLVRDKGLAQARKGLGFGDAGQERLIALEPCEFLLESLLALRREGIRRALGRKPLRRKETLLRERRNHAASRLLRFPHALQGRKYLFLHAEVLLPLPEALAERRGEQGDKTELFIEARLFKARRIRLSSPLSIAAML